MNIGLDRPDVANIRISPQVEIKKARIVNSTLLGIPLTYADDVKEKINYYAFTNQDV